jgi:hypothetical protein
MEYSDDPSFTKPKKAKAFIEGNFFLKTKDINATVEPVFFDRREWKNTNYIGDIVGAQADSIKHSIVTRRSTNPLQPIYEGLDYGEPLRPSIEPLLPSNAVSIPTMRRKQSDLSYTQAGGGSALQSAGSLVMTKSANNSDGNFNTAYKSQESAIKSYAEKFADSGSFIDATGTNSTIYAHSHSKSSFSCVLTFRSPTPAFTRLLYFCVLSIFLNYLFCSFFLK